MALCIYTMHTRRNRLACLSSCVRAQPPSPRLASDAIGAQSELSLRERLADLEQYRAPRKTDAAQWAVDASGAIDGADALIDALGENNPILKGMLERAKAEIKTAAIDNAARPPPPPPDAIARAAGAATAGRRLMQRVEYNTRMTDVMITHELATFYGKGGIPGVTYGSCESLCEATKQDARAAQTDQCNAIAFKRAAPFSYTDQTGWCYLLQASRALDPPRVAMVADKRPFRRRMRAPASSRTLG